ncbi:MAG: hypothetical protein U0992_02555 [Planctomycetaceae bacterium]
MKFRPWRRSGLCTSHRAEATAGAHAFAADSGSRRPQARSGLVAAGRADSVPEMVSTFGDASEVKVLLELYASRDELLKVMGDEVALLDKQVFTRQCQRVEREFESLSEYRQGDDPVRIDWRTTGAARRPDAAVPDRAAPRRDDRHRLRTADGDVDRSRIEAGRCRCANYGLARRAPGRGPVRTGDVRQRSAGVLAADRRSVVDQRSRSSL